MLSLFNMEQLPNTVSPVEQMERIPSVESVAERMDFQLLESIFKERMQLYGVQKDVSAELVPKQNITESDTPPGRFLCLYNPQTRNFTFFPQYLKEYYPDPKDYALGVVHTMCHEQTHALSHTSCEGFSNTENTQAVITRTLGLHTIQELYAIHANGLQPQGQVHLFEFLNEGLTEKFGRSVFAEYLNRENTLGTSTEKEMFLQKLETLPFPYKENIRIIDMFITKVANETGIPETTVEEAMIAALFRGESFLDTNLFNELNKITDSSFMEKLAQQKTRQDTTEIETILSNNN